jgi:hypothetical protein
VNFIIRLPLLVSVSLNFEEPFHNFIILLICFYPNEIVHQEKGGPIAVVADSAAWASWLDGRATDFCGNCYEIPYNKGVVDWWCEIYFFKYGRLSSLLSRLWRYYRAKRPHSEDVSWCTVYPFSRYMISMFDSGLIHFYLPLFAYSIKIKIERNKVLRNKPKINRNRTSFSLFRFELKIFVFVSWTP